MNELTTSAAALRKQHKKPKTEHEPCYVCGKHRTITQQHHIISLKKCAEIFNRTAIKKVNAPLIWLCPNCHSYIHRLLKLDFISVMREARIYQSISEEELSQLIEIGGKESKIEGEIYESFIRVLNNE